MSYAGENTGSLILLEMRANEERPLPSAKTGEQVERVRGAETETVTSQPA